MGCGISTMDGGDARLARPRRGRFCHAHANIVPQPSVDDDNDSHEATRKEEGFNGEKLKEGKNVVDRKEEERGVFVNNEKQRKLEEGINVSNGNKNVTNYEDVKINNDNDKDDRFIIGPGSPSFREYCNDNNSMDRSSTRDYNDHIELGGITKNNNSDNDSRKLTNEKSLSSNKEPEKKERRGRGGFRNVMNKGMAKGGRKNLLNFACYNSSTQSYAEGSFNKVVAKTT
ncbi:unnamed protein product [Trifolium pratense]|uniref:Uncharacterized protein n=1 Tax=Trifolium pratense TaxID=57577 RepID=A0ACB0LVF8_TRIPR|nr:unnamed protein product [Trifolium pratense]